MQIIWKNFDAIACYEEWVVDGVDPQDGGVEIIFAPDLTEEKRIKVRA